MTVSNEFSSYFLYNEEQKKQINFLEQVFKLGINFVTGRVRGNKALNYLNLEELKELFDEIIPSKGATYDELLYLLEHKVAKYSIAQSDQGFLAFPDTGNSLATFAADILGSFLNQNLIAVERSAPTGTFVELQVLLWLRQLVGYESYSLNKLPDLAHIGAMWTSGGNMSNYTAVLVALNNKFPEIKKSGLTCLAYKPGIILAKGIEHFSFAGATASLGLGEDGLIWSKSDKNYKSDLDELENTIKSCPKDRKPFMLVCVAGNCRTTSIDDIVSCSKLAKKYDLWFHVDACHGGSLLFSKKMRHLLNGIELADSISLDPHKGLFVTYPSSYVLFKNPKSLAKFCRYPEKASDPTVLDLGLIMPFFGSRGFHSLKLWLLIKHLGLDGLDEVIESRQQINIQMSKLLDTTKLFVFLNDNQFYRQVFVFLPQALKNFLYDTPSIDTDHMHKLIDKYTQEFCDSLYKQGKVIFDLFSLVDNNNNVGLGNDKKYITIAMAIGHPFILEENQREIINIVMNVGNSLKNKMLAEIKQLYDGRQTEKFDFLATTSPASW